ncbi:hypothetical protein [Collimonas humicola]|uniref:hypothetical protein n=1 Tax=Collimonas humicola TaxID=2825886 RepID=UPI001B8DA0D7|nr:hypothetical protein [Collimonas humicola]
MKTTLMLAFVLPLMSACASSSPTDADEAANAEPKEYVTGSIIPSHARKASGGQAVEALLPANYGSTVTPYTGYGNGR